MCQNFILCGRGKDLENRGGDSPAQPARSNIAKRYSQGQGDKGSWVFNRESSITLPKAKLLGAPRKLELCSNFRRSPFLQIACEKCHDKIFAQQQKTNISN